MPAAKKKAKPKTPVQKTTAFVGNYPASTLTPLVAAFLLWAQENWHWDKSDKKLAWAVLAFVPAVITVLNQKVFPWIAGTFWPWLKGLFKKKG